MNKRLDWPEKGGSRAKERRERKKRAKPFAGMATGSWTPSNITSLKREIYIKATDYGTVHHIHLQNLLIHDVNGDLKDKNNGGIFYEITGSSKPTKFDDFLIDGCHIYDVDRTGFSNRSSWQTRTFTVNTNWYPSTNVVIRGNLIERTGNNGLIVRVCDGALVEHNVLKQCSIKGSGSAMFPFNCDNTIVQYNEAYQTVYNPGDADASGFDSDQQCLSTVLARPSIHLTRSLHLVGR